MSMFTLLLTTLISLQATTVDASQPLSPLQFSVTHDGSKADSITGRVYVMMTRGVLPPLGGPNWWNPEPFFAIEVENWNSGEPLIIDDTAENMGVPLSEIGDGPWKAVAVFREQNDRSKLTVQGGLYGEIVEFDHTSAIAGTIPIEVNTKVPERTWALHKNLRKDEVKSNLLSEFYGREVEHGACVIVPDDYDQNRAEPYPVMYWIGGFGSDHYGGRFMKSLFTGSDYDDQICRVILNAQHYGGHHVFADSENTGPRMTALMDEFIPYLEEKYNLGGSAKNRYVSGHSSGGWTAFWLLVNNPDFFDGIWSLAPDPIDFNYFQNADLYTENASMYTDEQGLDLPLARMQEKAVLFTRGFTAMDDVIGDGGQIRSFEWVFSPKGEDGKPMYMFNRETGAINPEVAKHWEKYDIRKILEDNWETLSPKLSGKINIMMGSLDTFYLENAVIALRDFFNEKGFDANIEIIDGGNHGTVFRGSTIKKMDEWYANRLQLTNHQVPLQGPALPVQP